MDRTDKRVRKAETAAEQRKNQIVKLVEWAQNRHAAFTALTKDLHLQLVMEKEEAAGILEGDSAAMQVVLDELETLELPHERKPIAIQRAEAAAAAKAQGHRRSSPDHERREDPGRTGRNIRREVHGRRIPVRFQLAPGRGHGRNGDRVLSQNDGKRPSGRVPRLSPRPQDPRV